MYLKTQKDHHCKGITSIVTKINSNRKLDKLSKNDFHVSILQKVTEYFRNIFKHDCISGTVTVYQQNKREDNIEILPYNSFQKVTLRDYYVYVRDYIIVIHVY